MHDSCLHFIPGVSNPDQGKCITLELQRRRKVLSSGGDRITAWDLGGAVSPPVGPGQSPGGVPGGEAPGSSAIFTNSA